MDLTVLSWLWRGWRPVYDHRHVNWRHEQLKQYMTIPYRHVCITDDPAGIHCETFPLWRTKGGRLSGDRRWNYGDDPRPDCFARLRIFDPRVGSWFGERLLSLDLDAVIIKDLAPLVTDDTFKAARGFKSYLCGTMWQLQVGHHADVWADFDPDKSREAIETSGQYGSDQVWMSLKMPRAPLWDAADGVYWFKRLQPQRIVPSDARLVYFAGNIKPWDRACQMICPDLYVEL